MQAPCLIRGASGQPKLAQLLLPVLILMCAIGAIRVHADTPELVLWDNLVPSVEPYDDPFVDMSYRALDDLRDVLRARDARAAGAEDPTLQDVGAAALERLDAAGLDADQLLAQRLVVMERRREEATGVTARYLDQEVLIDGYALPLTSENGRVTEFLLVPWIGACIHTPRPPPNQIVHVIYPEGIVFETYFEPLRLGGTLRHQPQVHDLFLIDGSRQVPAAYSLQDVQITGVPGEIVASSSTDLPLLARVQIWVNGLFTSGMSAIADGRSLQAMVWALLLAFGYGALHTLGPGHGKAVVVSYFVGTGGSLHRGLAMGTRIAVFHVLSAVAVIFLFDLAVRQATGAAPSDYRAIRLASYSLIIVIGVYLFWQAVSSYRLTVSAAVSGGLPHDRTHDHRHNNPYAHNHLGHDHAGCAACAAGSAQAGGGWLAAAVGIVPCTGALLVMLFGLANNLIWPAVAMVVAISVGMAVAMAAIGIAALWGRDWAERRLGPDQERRARFALTTRFAGSMSVIAIGAILFGVTWHHNTFLELPGTTVAMQWTEGASLTE
ncbi:MAG: DUF3299 domain-containing protein [Pseudomonadota bacterium]